MDGRARRGGRGPRNRSLLGRGADVLGRCWAQRRRYAVAWLFLGGFALAGVVSAMLPAPARSALLWWASTDQANLRRHPAGSLILSAFFPEGGSSLVWLPLIALAAFGANRALGNGRFAVLIGAGHVVGTLVSEGILGYQIAHGRLPASAAVLLDIGPSYVVVSAIAAALCCGSHPARLVAGADLALLVFAGNIFRGLSTLQVAAVGHVTALAVAAPLSAALMRGREIGGPDPLTLLIAILLLIRAPMRPLVRSGIRLIPVPAQLSVKTSACRDASGI